MKKRYVYYNQKTGQILEIRSQRKRGRSYYIECDNSKVVDFIAGKKGINEFIVVKLWGKNEYDIFPKDNIIRLRQKSTKPIKIPYKKDSITDLTLVYYPDNVLEVSLDLTNIAPVFQSDFQKDVKFEKGTEIRIIVREKDSGNLLKEFIIDAQDLLESGQIFLELYDHIYPNNVEFFTYDLFSSFSWYKGDKKLLSPVKENLKFEINKADTKERSDSFTYHLIMKKDENKIKIINNITNLKICRINSPITFYLVDKYNLNILYKKFVITKNMFKRKQFYIEFNENLEDKIILYNHKYISVLMKG